MAQSSPLSYSIHLTDEGATEAFGAVLGRALQAASLTSALLCLSGDLGAGKTCLARGFLRGLGHEGPVPSPTYALLEPYRLQGVDVNHLDLYRLADASELEFLGWRDLADTIRLVEWPERATRLLGTADLLIQLRVAGAGRDAMLEAGTDRGASLLRQLLVD
ncbi:MAG: tRNA (adenosine(37)-N6)-threonylcarbamoyltransferase complex ATPase subunit type 1 TsaE [Pseudomonadota bacterium]